LAGYTLTLRKPVYLSNREKSNSVGMLERYWILDTGYRISWNTPGVRTKNHQHPESRYIAADSHRNILST
jgi:hypothetical protein